MAHTIFQLTAYAVFIPLLAAAIAGLFRNQIGRVGAHSITILGVGASFVLSLFICKWIVFDGEPAINQTLYVWSNIAGISGMQFQIGFLVDQLTSIMMVTVTFVSLLVHIYSMGYMAEDKGYQRFFSYISLFTFMMLMLVTANNFLQLFFGWEGVGLVSYLLIGFWFKRESALQGSLKAFLVNRVGDFGFLLGIAMVLAYAGSIDYDVVFKQVPNIIQHSIVIWPGHTWSVITMMCLLLFVGAMGKSAQVPLHVWLPESMEGPTPISALIHAATMVTAGVFMVARLSPLFEYSQVALSFILVIGATGALFTGLIAIVQNDIKRVVAYSTLSQLGYMMAAQGASAYPAGIFHLVTHACFKAVLFLAAGSVIIAMHHEQDMRKMGGLRKYMPITYITTLIGTLALVAIPPFAGFYSKDVIIEAVHEIAIPGARYAYWCLTLGAAVTAFYSFRAFFLTFHTKEKMDQHTREHLHESPWSVTLPLIILAIPSAILGAMFIKPALFTEPTLLGNSVLVLPQHDVLRVLSEEFTGIGAMITHAVHGLVFWLTLGGVIAAWICYILMPMIPQLIVSRFTWLYQVLIHKYGFDDFNQLVFVKGGRGLGKLFFKAGDRFAIDGVCVNGLAHVVHWFSHRLRYSQSGYLYHYALVMVITMLLFLSWLLLG
ncbi:MAG: NADH-quinone oxidoreductase subunit L [Gammaproteobacteria bacterium]